MDEAIAQVVEICGASPERAAQYVQLSDGDASQAIQLYFESGGADLLGSQPTDAQQMTENEMGHAQNPVSVDDEANLDDNNDNDDDDEPIITRVQKAQPANQPRATDVTSDEMMARRLQEEMYGDTEASIRAPIARQTETLLGPSVEDMGYNGASLDAAIQQRMAAMQSRRGSGFRAPGIFSQQQPTSHIWSGHHNPSALSEATGGASEGSSRNGMLARLYQPPWELMWKGSWEDARDEGKEHKKWMIVNIQDASIFDCQVLNRDLWKNEGVVDTVKENFVFLQFAKDDPRADPYIQYYFHDSDVPDAYPHVAIVDPRTGEQIKLWSRSIPKAPDFLMQIHEFLDRYSLEVGARNPVAKRKAEAKKSFDQMTEDEQLEQALHASVAGQRKGSQAPVEDPDDLTRSVGDLRKHEPGNAKDDAMSIIEPEMPASDTPFTQIPSDEPHEEPAAGQGVTRVQIRHPAGRIVRRFHESDPVQRIYEYLKAEPLEGRDGKEFELIALGKNLMESRQVTIEQAGLKNGTIMIEFVD